MRRGGRREPAALRRGKRFQAEVRRDFELHNQAGELRFEARISFEEMERIRRRFGRADILVSGFRDGDEEHAAIYEIKATDWDRIREGNVVRNLWRHQRQLWDYMNKLWHIDGLGLSYGIIYPEPPRRPGLREFIERTLEERYSVPAYWFTEVRSEPEGRR